MRERWSKNEILGMASNHIVDYPTPGNLSYGWGFGSLAGLCLVIQIVTGIFLAMHYCAHVDLAFGSVEHIMRDVNNGWMLRYFHSNGASMFFIVVYIHMFRGLYYGSYSNPRGHLWCSGVLLFFLMMATGFIGYVLPWGQMSLWGATVITNLVSAVPVVGKSIVEWLWGGFSVDNATLNRFFSLHYLLPFLIAGLSLVHLVLLHIEGSSNALGVDTKVDKIGFYPYCYVKDLFGFLVLFGGLGYLVFFNPNVLGHSDNYILADSMKTPEHIVPEWYFLPFYAILRTITHKLGGVVAMLLAIVGLMLLPYINTGEVRSGAFRPLMRKLFWLFVGDCVLLGWIGQKAVDYPYQEVGQVLGLFYFVFLFVLIPGVSRFEVSAMRG